SDTPRRRPTDRIPTGAPHGPAGAVGVAAGPDRPPRPEQGPVRVSGLVEARPVTLHVRLRAVDSPPLQASFGGCRRKFVPGPSPSPPCGSGRRGGGGAEAGRRQYGRAGHAASANRPSCVTVTHGGAAP